MSGDSEFGVVSLTVITVLFIYAIAGAFFEHKHFHFIHETGLGILLGILAGGIFYVVYDNNLQSLYKFNGSFFFYILLPVIIFSGGYNLNKRRFFQNFLYISVFGIIGTIVTFVIILGLTYLINDNGWITISGQNGDVIRLTTQQIMIFSATICASDSVAALTMIKPEKYPKLFSVVFGEGMVNDAVSIIIFVSVGLLVVDEEDGDTGIIPLQLLWLFFKEFVLSIIVGFLIGLFTAWLFKMMRFLTDSCILETAIIIYMGYASFTLCEISGLSGVISVLVSGVVMGHYNFYNISQIGKISSQVTIQTLSLVCESFIYVYLGVSIWILAGTKDGPSVKTSWSFVGWEILICFSARGLSITLLTLITEIFTGRKNFKLSFWELNIVWFAGLIRGSVAYALIQKLHASDDNPLQLAQVQVIQTTVLFMVILTTIILGALMPLYIVYNLKFQEKFADATQVGDGQPLHESLFRGTLVSGGEIVGGRGESRRESKKSTRFQKWVRTIDEGYVKPFFIFNYVERKQEIEQSKKQYKKQEDPVAQDKLKGSHRQKSMAIAHVISDNKESYRKTQGERKTLAGRTSADKMTKVIFRTTFNSKFMGNQELVFDIDVPTIETPEEDNDNDSRERSDSINSDIIVRGMVEEEMSSKVDQM